MIILYGGWHGSRNVVHPSSSSSSSRRPSEPLRRSVTLAISDLHSVTAVESRYPPEPC